MSRISKVLKNKNKTAKKQKLRRKQEIESLKRDSMYKAKLNEELEKLNMILENSEVDYVIVKVPSKLIAKFNEAIYSVQLAEYNIEQVEGKADEFKLSYKCITL